ncbi:MAG: ABC transporter substrate-binding protein [Promicromonosporaceae bacterium]|nr:ABC transporter substrate-binding protein [Promicromonosporaceae bacterium]
MPLALAAILVLGACGSGEAPVDGAGPSAVRLGYFPNVTHAPALFALSEGLFEAELGDVSLERQAFNAGPSAIEALNAGAIDAAFIGPNPAINGFVRSGGQALRIVAGTTSGGAQLVVRKGIASISDLVGTTLATPQLGNTQDVALRWFLSEHNLTFATGQGAQVSVTPTENSQAFQLFQQGRLDGAWVPEPWSSRLVVDAGAHLLIDERDEWPDGQFVTTHLIVRTAFLEEHPEQVEALLRGLVAAHDAIEADPAAAKQIVNAEIESAAGAPLSEAVIERAFENLQFTIDPIASTLQAMLDHAVAVEQSVAEPLNGIYDLRLLNRVLTEAGREPVTAAGLGLE